MKHIKQILITALLCLTAQNASAESYRMEINKDWKFRQARLTNWYPAKVPGVVHTDLMDNGIIEDPFYRLNERAVQWVDKEDWVYETTIVPTADIVNAENQVLRFKGLDTYADIYLNDSLLMKTDNMFREWNVDVKGILHPGNNTLRVYFNSPIKVDMPKWEALPYHLEASNDQSENGGLMDRKLSVFARKAGYHYGWDWGPRLVTSGIWRPVYLDGWNSARIDNVQVIQREVTKAEAKISSVIEVEAADNNQEGTVCILVNGKQVAQQTVTLNKGLNGCKVDYTIKKPRLWWTNGLGEQYRYDFTTKVYVNGKCQDVKDCKIGIRSLKMVAEKDKYGTSLQFVLNGMPVFMKGANYIPSDNFLPRVTYEKYQQTILDAKNANMNMLRVWGGGIYENDEFYDLCDEYGILIWQDFMFACSLYPGDREFLANVRAEAIDNVKRLRNHPCMALWCGNNEVQDAWFGWGWKRKYTKLGVADLLWKQLKELYYSVLPEVVKEYGGGISYRPTSPYATPDGRSDGVNGDTHYWGVWHGNHPIEQYNTERSRFHAEYGFQSFPEYESVKIYAPEARDHDIYSEVMMAHQRAGDFANRRINEYMQRNYNVPSDFEKFLYVGMILQGDAIKIAMEAHRRDMPYCMGSLFWQHNDCWPVASWSSRDYYGRWKAQHYYAKKAFDMILVSPYIHGDSVTVSIVSDLPKATKGELVVQTMDLSGRVIYDYKKNVTVKGNASSLMFEMPAETMLNGAKKEDVIVYTSLKTADKTYENVGYFVAQKQMNYAKQSIASRIAEAGGGYEVTLSSPGFARGVFMSIDGIDNFFEDNYFDLLPGRERTVMVRTSLPKAEFEKQLKIISLVDSYK